MDESNIEMKNLWTKLVEEKGPSQNIRFKMKMSPTIGETNMETIVEQEDVDGSDSSDEPEEVKLTDYKDEFEEMEDKL